MRNEPSAGPVYASPADWEALAGRWRGSYTTSEPNRRGLIDFTLSSSGERASGDVLMIAEGSAFRIVLYPPGDPRLAPIETAYTQLLTISFVRAERGQISGTIASYWDPDRSCQASATFLVRRSPTRSMGHSPPPAKTAYGSSAANGESHGKRRLHADSRDFLEGVIFMIPFDSNESQGRLPIRLRLRLAQETQRLK